MFTSETILPLTIRYDNIDHYAKEKGTKILNYNKAQSLELYIKSVKKGNKKKNYLSRTYF